MTEKRFTYNNGFVCDNQTGSCYEMFKNRDGRDMADLLNALHEENQVLKRELQNIYDIATLNKAVSIIEKKYDDYLYDKDVDCIPCKRKAYLECIELLDDFRDDLE